MKLQKMILIGILMSGVFANAEYSYMDSIQRTRLQYNAASWLGFRSRMMLFPTSNERGQFSYAKFENMKKLNSEELEGSVNREFQNRFSSKDKVQMVVDSVPLLIPVFSKLGDLKKDSELVKNVQNKFDRVLYYNAWYNNDKDSFKPIDDYIFMMKQIGEPTVFLAAEHCVNKLAETETGKKVIQSIPQEYQEIGKTGLAVIAAKSATLGLMASQKGSDPIAAVKQTSKNLIIDFGSHAAEKYIATPLANKVAEKIAGPGDGYVKTGLNFMANTAALYVVTQAVSKL